MGTHFTQEDIEERSRALLRDLEAARDPVTYRQRYHQRHDSEQPAPDKATQQRSRTAINHATQGGPRRAPGSVAVTREVNPQTWATPSIVAMGFMVLMGALLGSTLVGYLM